MLPSSKNFLPLTSLLLLFFLFFILFMNKRSGPSCANNSLSLNDRKHLINTNDYVNVIVNGKLTVRVKS